MYSTASSIGITSASLKNADCKIVLVRLTHSDFDSLVDSIDCVKLNVVISNVFLSVSEDDVQLLHLTTGS